MRFASDDSDPLTVGGDDLAESLHKFSLQTPDRPHVESLELCRSSHLKLDLGLLDPLHEILLPGVDHQEVRYSASSKFVRISMSR